MTIRESQPTDLFKYTISDEARTNYDSFNAQQKACVNHMLNACVNHMLNAVGTNGEGKFLVEGVPMEESRYPLSPRSKRKHQNKKSMRISINGDEDNGRAVRALFYITNYPHQLELYQLYQQHVPADDIDLIRNFFIYMEKLNNCTTMKLPWENYDYQLPGPFLRAIRIPTNPAFTMSLLYRLYVRKIKIVDRGIFLRYNKQAFWKKNIAQINSNLIFDLL